MLKRTLVLVLVLVLAAAFAAATAVTVDARPFATIRELAPTSSCRPGSPTELRCLHNYARRVNALPPLQPVAALYRAAALKADRIVECRQFSHSPCGDPWTRSFDQAGYRGSWQAENIAYGYPSIRDTFAGWLRSPGHRANILNPRLSQYGSAYRPAFPRLWVVAFGG
jgi:uncharacterized protein YkwD